MKKTKLFLIAIVAIIAAVACKKEDNSPKPVASFNITSNDTLNMSEEFSFTNTSTNATSYTWNFGDGTTATTTNATKVYEFGSSVVTDEFNTVTITLTARDNNGKSSTATKNIVVTGYM